MKNLLLVILGWMLGSTVLAQTFSGSGGSIPGTATSATCFPINVTGVGNINTTTLGLAQVCFTITHPFLDELEVTLRAPDGTTVPLTIQNGGSGDNYTNTCFSATATNSIKFGTPPFTGTYLPEGYLGAVNNGQNANGQWRLCVQDRRTSGNAGVLNSWNLTFNNTPAPAPPALPTCVTTLSSSSSCASAPAICDFNGLCGSTSGSTVQTWTQLTSASCFGFQNNFFVRFVAAASTASFSVWVPTSSSTFPNGGVQMLFFSGTCGSGPVTTYGCYPHILPYSAGSPIISVVTASGLTPGNTYYILIDGFGGDVSTFRLAATSGVNVFAVTPDSASICQGGSVTLNATGGNNVYNWSPSSGLNTTTGPTVIANPSATTTYTATSSTPLGCPINRTAVVTVNTPPQISTEPITNPQTVCQGDPFASVTLAAFTGSGTSNTVQWYSNTTPTNTGGTLIPGANVPTFQPSSTLLGTTYYYAVVTNNLGCRDTSAVVGPITVTPAIAAPVFSLGASSTRCPAAGTVVYGATGTTATITYTLDATSLAAGNTINPTTGEVTYVAGWTGTAVITATVAGCSGPLSVSHSATTTTPVIPVTNFSYASPVCATGPNPTPALAPGFTSGGTFSAPAGISINPTTGAIDLSSSTPGTYTVTYNLPADLASCRAAASGSASISITAITPAVTNFSYSSPICASASNPSPALGAGFTSGGAFSAPAGLTINAATGQVNLATSTPGTYLVTYTVPFDPVGCRAAGTGTASLTITPVAVPVTNFSYSGPVCSNVANLAPVLGSGFTSGGIFGSTAGLIINPTTGVIDVAASTPGTYSVTYNIPANTATCQASGSGAASITISAVTTPVTNFSYSSPVCSTGPNPTPSFGAGFTPGGTFSAPAGLSINPTTGIIDLSSSTLGTYTVTYTVPADPATCRAAASGTATITINAVITPVTSFLYVSPICLNGTNALPVLGPGFTAGGTWTSVPSTGISLNPTTGEINVGSSTAGNYTITYTISGLACAIGGTASSSLIVNLTPGQTANTNFSYNSPVCNSTASQLPQLAVGFTTGGTFTASSGGLAINNTTGQINHGVSTPGTYTVTYAVPASGCRPAASGTATITISPVVTPVTGFTYPSPVCQNSGTLSPTLVPGFTMGGAFTAPAGLSIIGSTGVINTNTSTPGTYTVAYNLPPSGCNPAGSGTFAVTITPVVTPVTNFSYPGPICVNGIATAPNTQVGFTFGGTFNGSPAGLSINPTTGIITPGTSTPGTYTVTYAIPASGCNPAGSSTASVTISAVTTPVTNFSYPSPVCQGTGPYLPVLGTGFTPGGIFSGNGGLGVNAATGQLNTASAAPGTYTIAYIVAATGCNPASTSTFDLEISPATAPVVGFTLPASVCGGSGIVNPTQATGFTNGGTFSATPAGLAINASTGAINTNTSTPGSYTVTYNVAANGCRPAGSESIPFTINAVAIPVTDFSYSNPICQNTGSVSPLLAVNFTSGGIFSAPSGLTLNPTTGAINTNTSAAGTYLVTYSISTAGCNPAGSSTFSITITPATTPVTQFTIPASICSADGLITPTVVGGFTPGGTFSSAPAGLSINPTTGVINPATSTPGSYTVIYEVLANGCNPPASTSVPTVLTATTTAQLGFSYLSPVCQTAAFLGPTFAPGFTPGGNFTAPAGLSINATTGLLNLGTSAAGTYTVTYTLATVGCAVGGTSNAIIRIDAPSAPTTNFSYTTPVCANGTNPTPITGAGFTVGGTYSAPAGLSINSSTGVVNLSASTPGTYLVTYSVAAGACSLAGSSTFSLTILPNTTPNTTFTYAGPVCNNATPLSPTLSVGFVTGGTFSSTSGLTINATTGTITPASSTPGTYTVTYQIAASGCQPAGTGTATITIQPTITPVVGFSYATPVCIRSTAAVTPQLAVGFTAGGQFSSTPAGLSLNTTTGAVNVGSSNAGTYTITYTLASNGCQLAAVQNASLVILPATTPGTNFSYATPVCASVTGNALPIPGVGFTAGGVFSATGGLTINAATGAVSLSSNPPGSYTITYSFVGGNTPGNCVTPSTRTAPLVIQPNTQPVVSFSYPTPVCSYGSATLAPQLTTGFTTGGSFSASGGLVINPTTGVVTLSGQAAGTYTITYQVSTPCTTASNSTSLVIRDVPIPTVPPVGVCDSGTVTFQASGVGTFEWFSDPALTQLVNTGNTFSVFTNRDTVFYVRSFLNGCNSVGFTAAQALVVAPPVKPVLGRDTLLCAGDAISLQSATFNSTYQYLWNTGTSGAALSVTQPGTYILTATILPAGCSSSDTVVIGQYTICDDIYFPNAFSPNNDGLNDRFGALGNIAPVTRYTLVIYNRWGQAVFTAANPAQRWDGTMNGKAQDPGNFTYRVQYDYRGRPRTRSGNLMLVR